MPTGSRGTIIDVPTISRFFGIVIAMFFRCHEPPHFHARHADRVTPEGFRRASVDADTGTVVWPGGADLAPDTLCERVRTGVWPEQDAAA